MLKENSVEKERERERTKERKTEGTENNDVFAVARIYVSMWSQHIVTHSHIPVHMLMHEDRYKHR